MLKDYKGSANSTDVFQHLVGERLTAVFRVVFASATVIYFVTESGPAFVVNERGVFWVESPEKVARVVKDRREEIERHIKELKDMAGVQFGEEK